MKKILVFSGSNSSNSVNRKLAEATGQQLSGAEITHLDLTSLNIPMYGEDLEKSEGQPQGITELVAQLNGHDGFIISVPEHNGLMPAFFKNILDWLSRAQEKPMKDKPTLLMSTSPGRGGAAKAADATSRILGYGGTDILGPFSLPSFHENFDAENNVVSNAELQSQLVSLMDELMK